MKTQCKSDNGIVLAKFKETTHQQLLDEFQVVFDCDCKQLSEVKKANITHGTHKESAYLGFFFYRKRAWKMRIPLALVVFGSKLIVVVIKMNLNGVDLHVIFIEAQISRFSVGVKCHVFVKATINRLCSLKNISLKFRSGQISYIKRSKYPCVSQTELSSSCTVTITGEH